MDWGRLKNCRRPASGTRSAQVLADVHPANGRGIIVDVVIIEIAGELGGDFFFLPALETAPRGITQLLAALLGGVQVFGQTIEVHVGGGLERGFFLVFVELLRLRFLVHFRKRSDLRCARYRTMRGVMQWG